MIWLIGCNGMLGKEIARELSEQKMTFMGTGSEIDITNKKVITSFIDNNKGIDWIINCCAYTNVEKAEENEKEADYLNHIGVIHLAELAKKIGATIIHISTDYVFDGERKEPYTEETARKPLNTYGKTKAAGEASLEESGCKYYIFRTAWLYGSDGKNFVNNMIKLMNIKKTLSVINNQYGTPTFTKTLASCIIKTIKNTYEGTPLPFGIYNCTDEGQASWYDFAQEIYALGKKNKIVTNSCSILPCSTEEFVSSVRRPAYSVLSKEKIQKALGIKLENWKKVLASFFESYDLYNRR